MLEPLSTNKHTSKDSLTFAEELQSFDSKLVKASFHTESLLTNIPLQETMYVDDAFLIFCSKHLKNSEMI